MAESGITSFAQGLCLLIRLSSISGDVLLQTKRTQLELCQLGCFSNVNALIDQNEDNPQDIDVFFTVEELPLSGYKYSLETGDDEELLKFGLSMPNLTGAGEKIESQFKIGTNGSQSWNLNYCWPLRSSLLWNQFTDGCRSNLSASVYGHSGFISRAGLKSISPFGLNLTAEISPKPYIVQLLQWDCSWRYLRPIDNHTASFATRSCSGHSLKSSLVNQVTINTLDDKVLPTKGIRLQLGQELAGLGIGNVAFLSTSANAALFHPISERVVFGGNFHLGHMLPINVKDNFESNCNNPVDKYSPKIRGFASHRVGPRESDGKTYLGSNTFWKMSLHLISAKMPFLRGSSWLVENVRGHAFAEVFSSENSTDSLVKWLITEPSKIFDKSRCSFGVGLLARLGNSGQAELNYCFPLRWNQSDTTNHGLQFSLNATLLE